MSNPFEDFCEQFGKSLVQATADTNPHSFTEWFGRLLAWQYTLDFDTNYDELTLRNKLRDKSLKITKMDVLKDTIEFTPNDQVTDLFNGTLSAEYDVEVEIDGNDKSGTYLFKHEIKLVYHAIESTATKK